MSPVCVLSGTREFLEISTLLFVLDTRRPIIVNRVFCGMFLSSATRTIDLLLRYSKRFAFRYLHRFFLPVHVPSDQCQSCFCGMFVYRATRTIDHAIAVFKKLLLLRSPVFFFFFYQIRPVSVNHFSCVCGVFFFFLFLPFFLQRTVVTMDRLRAFDPVSMRPCGVLAF